MKWDEGIDQAIMTTLLQNREIGYLKLKSKVDEQLKRTISFETFGFHLKKMLNQKIVNKQDYGKGRKALHSISKTARKKVELNLFNSDKTKSVAFIRIYEKILFYEAYHKPLYLLDTQDDLRKFLYRLNISEEDMIESPRERFMDKSYFVKGIEGLQIIERLEPKYSDSKVYYEYSLPGISIKEFMDYDEYELQPKLQHVKVSFSLLEKHGLVKKVPIYGEVRFMLTNSDLNEFAHELASTRTLEAHYLKHKWKYSRLPDETEFERLKWILGERQALKEFDNIKKYRESHGLRWKLMDRKICQQHRKDLQKQFQDKAAKLKIKVDSVKKKYATVLQDYEFFNDAIEIICPMVANWSYSDKLIVRPSIPNELDVDDSNLEPVSQLVNILWRDRLESLTKMKVKRSDRLYYWYQRYLKIFELLELKWHTLIDDYYEFIRLSQTQKILIDKVINLRTENGEGVNIEDQLSQDERSQSARYYFAVRRFQQYYEDFVHYTREIMRYLPRIASILINSHYKPSTISFALHKQFFLKAKHKPYKPNEAYAQLIRNETDWFEVVTNPQRDAHNRIDIRVRDYDGVLYSYPAGNDRHLIGERKLNELKKELEDVYPELLTVDGKLWSIIDYIKSNPHIQMNSIQKAKFQEIVSQVGIQLPDFMYLATSIQKFLQRFREIFISEERLRRPIVT